MMLHAFVVRVLLLGLWLAFATSAMAKSQAGDRIDFVYFASPNCPYCLAWEAYDLRRLEASEIFRQVRFTKIVKPIASPVPEASLFPREIRNFRNAIADTINGAGSPMFAILKNGHVVTSWRGSKRYSAEEILTIIRRQQANFAAGAVTAGAVMPAAVR